MCVCVCVCMCVCVCVCVCELCLQDLNLSETKIDPGNPEFKKLAFICPGPKSACVVKAGAYKTPVMLGVKSECTGGGGGGSQSAKLCTESSLQLSHMDRVNKVSWKYGKVF